MKKKILHNGKVEEMSMDDALKAYDGLIHSLVRRSCDDMGAHEDLYQEACIGFVKAYRKYDIKYGCQFSTLLTWEVRNALRNTYRDRNPRIGMLLKGASRTAYLDEEIKSDDNKPILLRDRLEDKHDVEDSVITKVDLERFINKLPAKHKKIFRLIIANNDTISQQEIGKQLGFSQPHVSRVLSRYKRKFKEAGGISQC
jgi:RNA polymerase sigma factor (sigma-70 family)